VLLAVSLLGLWYLKFLSHLPLKTCCLFIVAGGIYIFGAAGMEIISGHYLNAHQATLVNGEDFFYKMLDTVEETLEMLGIVLFLYAQLDYLTLQSEALEVEAVRSLPVTSRLPFLARKQASGILGKF
jgi:hypothetical protein